MNRLRAPYVKPISKRFVNWTYAEPEPREKITNIAPKYVTEVIDPIMKKLNWKPIFI